MKYRDKQGLAHLAAILEDECSVCRHPYATCEHEIAMRVRVDDRKAVRNCEKCGSSLLLDEAVVKKAAMDKAEPVKGEP